MLWTVSFIKLRTIPFKFSSWKSNISVYCSIKHKCSYINKKIWYWICWIVDLCLKDEDTETIDDCVVTITQVVEHDWNVVVAEITFYSRQLKRRNSPERKFKLCDLDVAIFSARSVNTVKKNTNLWQCFDLRPSISCCIVTLCQFLAWGWMWHLWCPHWMDDPHLKTYHSGLIKSIIISSWLEVSLFKTARDKILLFMRNDLHELWLFNYDILNCIKLISL